MAVYMRNRRCSCARCRAHGLTGPAVLVTLGVLFLLDSNRIVRFDQTWPVLLLVIGTVIFFSRTASTENHVQPYAIPVAMNIPTPPTGGTAGTQAGPADAGQNDSQVKP